MQERRYTQYKQMDVWLQLCNLASALKVQVLYGTVHGCSISLVRLDTGERLRAVILPRASNWYTFSLNIAEWQHGCTAIVCGTHDSCVNVPVLALDAMRWYESGKMRGIFGTLDSPEFERARRSHYGHNMLVGALMCGRGDAIAKLQSLPDSTRYRIESELRTLHTRRQGRPLVVGPDPLDGRTELSIVS
ncbi:MAG: hypothetical protein AUG51_16150 [Acidobacteria bacterium 13_1_20CM_3_53_8]|nr:MAG: hypothetical protein AUG51_16150 [Acidobacteria bacterium 13_1_20CM_3_53_8]